MKPEVSYKILATRWGLFSLMSFAIYFYHFCWAVGAVDKFCQVSRFNLCGSATNDSQASAIYDTGLILICIFHLIEWIR